MRKKVKEVVEKTLFCIMRKFIVLGHKASISPDFTLNDLPGSAGRLDILCRCVNSSFLLSHGIRKDVRLYLVLRDQVMLRFEGRKLRHLNPDERSTGALIQKALKKRSQVGDGKEVESTSGIFIAHLTLKKVLQKMETTVSKIYVLHEQGKDIKKANLPEHVAFVLSDHLDFSPKEEKILTKYDQLKVGPKILHADHAIIVMQNELDRIFCR